MSSSAPQDIRIFVSHSSADNVFGSRLAEDLRRMLGDPTSVWYDSDGGLRAGDAWWRTIVDEVTSRPIFLVIWSPDARDSKWVNDEIDLAWQLKNDVVGKKIFPVICRPCELRGDLRTRQAVVFYHPETYDERFRFLLTALGVSLDVETAPATPAIHPSMPEPAPTPTPALPPVPAPTSAPTPAPIPDLPPRTTVDLPSELIQSAPRRAPHELLLLSIDNHWPPARVQMSGSTVTIGRESGNDVVIADPAVSRFHLRLTRQRAGWQVEALPDSKPLYVNGEARVTALFGPGDQLVIGGTVLRLEPLVELATATTLGANLRTILASGFTPTLLVETHNVRFHAPLRAEIIHIGRAPDCGLVLPSWSISAHQAALHRSAHGEYDLEPVRGAPNPFLLAGHPVTRRITLRHGQTLTVGTVGAPDQLVKMTYLAPGAYSQER
jgi:pSer/pThr/pTyr-binding forkhead associated (FHA) protein